MTTYPKNTPWGAPQSRHIVAEGIAFYSTASHGGYWVSDARLAEMPAMLRGLTWADNGKNWFEEDCAACAVALAFPSVFTAEQTSAQQFLLSWKPEVFAAWASRNRAA